MTRTAPIPVLVIQRREREAEIAPVIRRVVGPRDGSPRAEAALPTATSLARRREVPGPLLTVVAVPPVALMPTMSVAAALDEAPVAPLPAEAEARRMQTSARLGQEGVTTTRQVLQGAPFQVSTDAVATGALIVLTSHGRGGARRGLRGSVAEKRIREGPAPVLLGPARERNRTGAIADEAVQATVPVIVT